jgi:hypothetical protein
MHFPGIIFQMLPGSQRFIGRWSSGCIKLRFTQVVIAESPLIDYLIVYSLDRLTPDCDEARKIRRLFRSASVILVAAAEDESPKANKQDPR